MSVITNVEELTRHKMKDWSRAMKYPPNLNRKSKKAVVINVESNSIINKQEY